MNLEGLRVGTAEVRSARVRFEQPGVVAPDPALLIPARARCNGACLGYGLAATLIDDGVWMRSSGGGRHGAGGGASGNRGEGSGAAQMGIAETMMHGGAGTMVRRCPAKAVPVDC